MPVFMKFDGVDRFKSHDVDASAGSFAFDPTFRGGVHVAAADPGSDAAVGDDFPTESVSFNYSRATVPFAEAGDEAASLGDGSVRSLSYDIDPLL